MDEWTPPTVIESAENRANGDSEQNWLLERTGGLAHSRTPLSLVRPDGVALSIDFTAGKSRHRTTESGSGVQALTKALGVRPYFNACGHFPLVIDATGGLGQDAWALASTGCSIIIIERHPVVHALLADGLARARDDKDCSTIAERITLIQADANNALESLAANDAHAVYLDPMYPERRKKASSKKGMQFLHALLGPPVVDDPVLLLTALASGVSRVAVKRPKGAPLLAGTDQFAGQRTVIESPNTRYDVYHCPPRPSDLGPVPQ